MHAARKDADAHFQFTDESSPAVTQRPASSSTSQGASLYHDPVSENFEDEPITKSSGPAENGRPASRGQRADMTEQWNFGTPKAEEKIYKTAGDGMGSRKGADAGTQATKSYKTAGDGM